MLQGFELAGPDQQWHPATAAIAGDAVVVGSPQVTKTVGGALRLG